MSLAELVQSSGWKNFISKLYGLGASVVIIGALFKIQHWPLAGEMLTLGLLTEAVIFFFSAFEPLHEEVDWSLVYPELAGIPEEDAANLPFIAENIRWQQYQAVVVVEQVQLLWQNLMKCLKKQKSHRIFSETWSRNEKT